MIENGQVANLRMEYDQINQNFRFLADVRFKLLALVPVLGGAAIFVLSKIGLQASTEVVSHADDLMVVLGVSLCGFLATLGITLYDQRNSELYNALIHRAKFLERQFVLPSAPGGLKKTFNGGQFIERPRKSRDFIFAKAGHDHALALIYGPILGAWAFPVFYTLLRITGATYDSAQTFSAVVAAIASLAITLALISMDKKEMRRYNEAAKRDGISEGVAGGMQVQEQQV